MNRYRVLDVDGADVRIEKTDLAAPAFEIPFERLAGKQGLKFPLLADTDKAVAALYGTTIFLVIIARSLPP